MVYLNVDEGNVLWLVIGGTFDNLNQTRTQYFPTLKRDFLMAKHTI